MDHENTGNDFNIDRFIDMAVPINTCNFRCHYCYITHTRSFAQKLPKFKHSSAQMAQAFSRKRFGVCVINLCAGGETLLAPEMPAITRALLEEGHIIMIVTNGTPRKAFDEFVLFPQELRDRLFIKFSFHYLELSRLKLLDHFFKNVQAMKASGISFTLEITPCDELFPYIEDIKKICVERAGALPHVTIARDEGDADYPILTKLSRNEYIEKWSQFDSALFNFKESVFGVKQAGFCYGGGATYNASLDTGVLKQCYQRKKLMNLYKNVNSRVKINLVGHGCQAPHCWNAHAWMGFGTVPAKNKDTPIYAQMRNRVCPDGSEWLCGDVKKAFSVRVKTDGYNISKNKSKEWVENKLASILKIYYNPAFRKIVSRIRGKR